ncbi:MAG TPA: hypothetical protein VHA56_22655 [Mucilaginibacter sp.]|nr:hypothetical protein [Mucilaginibacter sp.]
MNTERDITVVTATTAIIMITTMITTIITTIDLITKQAPEFAGPVSFPISPV